MEGAKIVWNGKTLSTWGASYYKETLLFKIKSCEQPAESSSIFSFSKKKVGVCLCVFGRGGFNLEHRY